ncbi:MAG TPA: hypothetical protein VFN67_22805 [Polyangiales bacterium]|nr:hypothetical protein [Polyangiales bacterium]
MATGHALLGKRTQLVTMLIAVLPTAACLDDYAEPRDPAPRAPQLGAAFVDARGWRWEQQRQVTKFAAAEPELQHDGEDPSPTRRWQDLPDELAAKRLRPITLTPDNYEYALDEAQTLEFVQQLRELGPLVPRSTPMATPEAQPALSERSARVLSEDRVPRQTFGEDGRVNMNGAADQAPWVFIGAMSRAGQCTAFKLLNKHTAISAAHCVHDGKEWSRRKAVQFSAGASSPRPAISEDCYSITVAGGWAGEDPEFDYAVIRLREDGLERGAACDPAAYDVGHFGYELIDECVADVELNLAGYPSIRDPDNPAPVGDWAYPSLFTDYRTDGWTACAGLYPSALWFYNDGSNGQSGSPVWTFHQETAQNQVRAIYRGSMTTIVGDSNRGRRFDESLIAWMTLNAGY